MDNALDYASEHDDDAQSVLTTDAPLDASTEAEGLAVGGMSASNDAARLFKRHPECLVQYAELIQSKLPVTIDEQGNYDEHHQTDPYMTIYEYTEMLQQRTSELAHGAQPYIKVPEHVTDVEDIARQELAERRVPYIVHRFSPDGRDEFWRAKDLLDPPM
jgi:DNA-directed RNA polymerase subunit K/omega